VNAPESLVQGSPEWLQARCGCATASEFSAVLAKGKEGITRRKYLRRLVGERLTGKPAETYSGKHTERGQAQEPFGRMLYEARKRVIVEPVGFIRHRDGLMAGCSPDGLIGDDGGEEIKCVIPTVQIDTILRGEYPPEHRPQIQGNLWITGRQWWDFVSYCEPMPTDLRLYVFRVHRDEEYIENLASEVANFLCEVDVLEAKLLARAPIVQATNPDAVASQI
jgi:hypothetical protein